MVDQTTSIRAQRLRESNIYFSNLKKKTLDIEIIQAHGWSNYLNRSSTTSRIYLSSLKQKRIKMWNSSGTRMVKLFESGFNGFKRGTWEEALAQPDWSKQVEFVNSSSNVKDDDDDTDHMIVMMMMMMKLRRNSRAARLRHIYFSFCNSGWRFSRCRCWQQWYW